ncbi:MAG TPA: ATP-binding protein, partial [Thermodesulfobacteriota bacterium]
IEASRLAAGRAPLNLRRLRLDGVVAEAIAQVRPLAAEKHVCVVTAVAPRLTLAADRLKLEQILVNLLTNAIRHSPPGGTIHVEGTPTGGDLELRVRDHGDGIPRGDLERIFLPFQQVNRTAEAARTARFGAGLGLAIVRSLVELHGGRIWAESDGPGRGSVFVVRLPVAAARQRAA